MPERAEGDGVGGVSEGEEDRRRCVRGALCARVEWVGVHGG